MWFEPGKVDRRVWEVLIPASVRTFGSDISQAALHSNPCAIQNQIAITH